MKSIDNFMNSMQSSSVIYFPEYRNLSYKSINSLFNFLSLAIFLDSKTAMISLKLRLLGGTKPVNKSLSHLNFKTNAVIISSNGINGGKYFEFGEEIP
ncbi:hypothetical protein WICMUC_002718 [Wickerhamomyces mucosus]|uniref:Uncharacterized protein n=1 Tax=Wickerhamomyces mucosus TaxID=1378264 RepID=A0A9P8PQ01_9ASCO|nr:hypothetical protein WICMUC_002718 [Wickerhamomyces mucosus]